MHRIQAHRPLSAACPRHHTPVSYTHLDVYKRQDLQAQADDLFAELGMNLSTAFNIFVRQSLREGGIPFEVKLEQPNKETIAAMLEAERIAKDPSVKGYNDLDELFAEDRKSTRLNSSHSGESRMPSSA